MQLFEEAAWSQLFIQNGFSTIFRHSAFLLVSFKQELCRIHDKLISHKNNQFFFTFISRPLRHKIKYYKRENVIFSEAENNRTIV